MYGKNISKFWLIHATGMPELPDVVGVQDGDMEATAEELETAREELEDRLLGTENSFWIW